MAKLKAGPKVLLIVLGVAGFVFGLQSAMSHGLIPTPGILKSVVLQKTADVPRVQDGEVTAGFVPAKFPTTTPAKVASTLIRGEIWEWNAQFGFLYSLGGPCTTKGSLMEKYNVNLCVFRQDDTTQMGADLIACAKEHASGSEQCSAGADFVVIMGDGGGQFISALNPQLEKLGKNYTLRVIGAVGYSRGEDAFMADPAILRDKNAAKGILVEAVLRDGDWNIVIKWASDNGVKVNPDEHTYDPDAINFLNAKDYNTAAADFAAGREDERKVVKDGRPTGETKKIQVNAVATWTPGDVVAAEQRGGVVKIASSKTYSSQMPAVIIGSNAFFQKNRDEIEGMLAAIFEGGDQVKSLDDVRHRAAQISYVDYGNDQSADYWYKYYKGVTERDKQGINVQLGGSYVNNLADNQILFGLNPGTNDNFKSTYTLFANYDTSLYPDLFKSTPIPPAKDVEDVTYIAGAQQKMSSNGGTGGAAETVDYAADQNGPVVSGKDYHIEFATGQATFTPAGAKTMEDLKNSTAITNLFITIKGYTDNVGDATPTGKQANINLSVARANAVKAYLQRSAPKNYPDTRFDVSGLGSADPVGDNSTADGKAANRRVHIELSGGQ